MACGVWIILGSDSYLAEQALQRLLKETVASGQGEAVEVIDGEEASWASVIDVARTGSLFVARRAVVVRRAEALKGDGEEISAYMDDHSPGTLLVLVAAKPDRRRAVWRRVLERGQTLSAEPLKGRALRSHVIDELRRRDLALAEEGLEELLGSLGPDLRRVMVEIDKLHAFAGGRRDALSAEEVAMVMGRGLAPPLYRLGDAVMRRRPVEVLQLMEDLLEEREAPLRILGTLQRSLRQVRAARALDEAGASRQEMIAKLGVPPFKIGDVLGSTKIWPGDDLATALVAMAGADASLKSGAEPRTALASAVVKACSRAGAASPRPSRVY